MYSVLWVTWVTVATTDLARGSQVPHCNMTVEEVLTDWDQMPWSCRTRCGEAYSQQPCACDHRCQLYTDCCDDFTALCGNTSQTSTTMTDAGISGQMNHSMSMKTLMGTVDCRHRTKFISRCPNPPLPLSQTPLLYGGKRITPDGVAPLCDTPPEEAEDEDVNQAMPVTDAASGHHFANIYCLLCHGASVEDAMPWSLSFVWNMKSIRSNASPAGIREVLQLAHEKKINTVALPPSNVTPRRCIPRNILYDFPCNCPNLAHECETANSSVISVDTKHILWHPSCAACLMVQSNKGYKLRKPNIENMAFLKNHFDFTTIMKWTSSPANNSRTALEVWAPPSQLKSFAWQHLTCDFEESSNNSNGNRKDLGVISGKENFQDASNGHEETLRESQTGAPSTGIGSSRSYPTPKDIRPSSNAGMETDEPDLVASQRLPTESTQISCTHRACSYGVPLLDNKCRMDLAILEVHLLITCLKLNTFIHPPMPDPQDVLSLQPAAIASITQIIQRYITTQVQENITVVDVNVNRTRNGCIWNTFVSLYRPTDVVFTVNETIEIVEQVYQILLDVNRESVDETGHALHACGYFLQLTRFNKRDYGDISKPCSMRATFRPSISHKKSSAQSEMTTRLSYVCALVCILLTCADSF